MLAHNKPQPSASSELTTQPHDSHRQSAQETQSSFLPQLHPRQERPKRKISHREPTAPRTMINSRFSHVNADHNATPAASAMSHRLKHIDSQEPMTSADSKTHLHGVYLQRPPSFEPFGIHRQDHNIQELPQQTMSLVEAEAHSKMVENPNACIHSIEQQNSDNGIASSHQHRLNTGRPARTDDQTKSNLAVIEGTAKHRDELDGRSSVSNITATSLFSGSGTNGNHKDMNPNQNTQHSFGQPMTIRDIIDSQDLRNYLSELQMSSNNNPDVHPSQFISSHAQKKPSINQQLSKYPQESPLSVQMDRTGSRRSLQDDDIADNQTMDTSLLESRFRAQLDADIQVLKPLQDLQNSIANGRATASSNIHESDFRKLLPSERQRRELYSSSYSPSNFSPAEESVEEESLDVSDNSEDEKQNTVELKRLDVATLAQAPLVSRSQQRPLNPTGSLNQPHEDPNERQGTTRPLGLGYESGGEISFEQEVAKARARRELGSSQDNVLTRPNGMGGPTIITSKLDHGRDLALEDLASPVQYNFGENRDEHLLRSNELRTNTVEQEPRRRIESMFPGMTGEEELERLNMFTRAEDRFMELAGSLGEGQAVASILETLKSMIRKLKSEKRTFMLKEKALTKDLKQTQRELRRTQRANEKLSKTKYATTTHRTRSGHDKDTIQDKDSIIHKTRRNESLEKEQEKKTAMIKRERERAERDHQAILKQLNALKKQKENIQKRKLLQAEEEADLMFLIESDSNSDEDEDESESESESESDSESESEESRAIQRHSESALSELTDRDTPLTDNQYRRRFKTNKRSSSKGASDVEKKGIQYHRPEVSNRRARDRVKSAMRNLGSRSKSSHLDTRRQVDSAEEVHIHHHVYYGDTDMDSVSNPRSKSNRLYHSTSRLDERYANHAIAHRLNIGSGHRINDTGFSSYRHGPAHQESLGKEPVNKSIFSRSFPGQNMHTSQQLATSIEELTPLRSLPRRNQNIPYVMSREEQEQQDFGSSIMASKDREAYPLYRPRPHTTVTSQGSARMVTRMQHGFHLRSSDPHELIIPLKNPKLQRKKISIDLQRILSLLKTHDPKRCTVCCNGGDGQNHAANHRNDRYSQHQYSKSPNTEEKSTTTQPKPLVSLHPTAQSSRLGRHRIGKSYRGHQNTLSDSESSLSSAPENEASDSIRTESKDYGAGVGAPFPIRRRSQSQPPRKTRTNPSDTNKDNDDDGDAGDEQPLEWKFHVTLCKLEKDVQQLRKWKMDLRKKLEQLESSLNIPTADAIDDREAITSVHPNVSLEELDKKRQQRSQLLLQQQRVIDKLEEKAEEILRLQQYLLVQQQQQKQQQQQQEQASHDQTEVTDIATASENIRVKRRVREPLVPEDTVDPREASLSTQQTESLGTRQICGEPNAKVLERYKPRTIVSRV